MPDFCDRCTKANCAICAAYKKWKAEEEKNREEKKKEDEKKKEEEKKKEKEKQ